MYSCEVAVTGIVLAVPVNGVWVNATQRTVPLIFFPGLHDHNVMEIFLTAV